MRIEICATRYKRISSAVQMSDVLSHKSMLLGDNFSPSEMELAPPHILLTLFALLLTLLTVFKMHVRTAPTANTAYLEVYMHIRICIYIWYKYIIYSFVVKTLGSEILEGIGSNYSTFLCSKKCLKKRLITSVLLSLLSKYTIRDGGCTALHCSLFTSFFISVRIFLSHEIFQFCSCIWQL